MRHPAGTTTPPGSPLSSPKSKRQRNPAPPPLSDVTNLLLPETPTPIKPTRTRTRLRPLPTPSSDASSTCSSKSTASVNPSSKAGDFIDEELSAAVQIKSSISTVYARRRWTTEAQRRRTTNPTTNTTPKGKEPVAAAAAAGTASCPPLGKATRKNSRKDTMAQDTQPISSSAPCHGAKKKRPPPSTPKLPEDFVKKQRAYFADVDAFELPEEEVSESELE